MKILITGSDGFIGRNLRIALRRRPDTECLGFDVNNPPEDLKKLASEADFVFHLAGVNRPRDSQDFTTGNVDLTRDLTHAIESAGKRTPIVFSSSIQAARDNPYGASKRQAEETLQTYHDRTGAPVGIFRFPNVFGKGSRPNYNSVVSTFCYNILHGLPVQVSNRENVLTLVHIDEVVRNLEACLSKRIEGVDFLGVSETFTLTLGELHDRIVAFHDLRERQEVPDMQDPLNRCLYSTYISYLEESECAVPVDLKTDNRGWLFELVKSKAGGQVFVSKTRPGITRGNHYHDRKIEKFCVIQGEGRIRIRNVLSDNIVTYDVTDSPIQVVDIPPGHTHSIENTGSGDMLTLFWTNEIFNPKAPDTWPENVVV